MSDEIYSLNLIKIKDGEDLSTTNRIINNSDIDISNNNSQINKISQNKENNYIIYNISNQLENNNENNYNENINNEINNENNENNDNEANSENNEIEDEKIHFELIKELKNDKFIYIKDYLEQEANKNNTKYVFWLQKIYIKIKSYKENKDFINKLKIRNKYEIPEYSELINKLKNNLFECSNPKCKSIIYLTDKSKIKLKIWH